MINVSNTPLESGLYTGLGHTTNPMLEDNVTNINLLGFLFTFLMGVLILFLPRRYALIPIIITTCYMTVGQQIVIVMFHFTILRIVIFFGWIRVTIRKEISSIRLNVIDKTIIWWVIASVVTYTLLYWTSADFINRLGFAYNVMGLYFLFRVFIRNFEDIERTIKFFSIIIVPLACAMLMENATGRNFFSIFGGVPEITEMRDMKLRCQGPFLHPILVGTFGATLIPLFLGLLIKGKSDRVKALMGLGAATIITVTSSSSGPILSYLFGIIGLCLWRFRNNMRAIGLGVVFSLIGLHIVMKDPVWYLMARISNLIGGKGWYRSYLIDQTVAHFSEWWLIGTKNTSQWMPFYFEWSNKADITNQYIGEAVNGGLFKLVLFIVVIVLCFRGIGRGLRFKQNQPFATKIILWGMGSALFAHVVSFFSVAYFDQIIVSWFLLLAMISNINSKSTKMEIINSRNNEQKTG